MDLERLLPEAVLTVFGVRASFSEDALPGASRLALGDGLPPLWVATAELGTMALVRRFALREAAQLRRLSVAEARLGELKNKTSRLLPGGAETSLGQWSIETADLALLERFSGWGIGLDGVAVRLFGLNRADVESTLLVLERAKERSVPVRSGELFGYRAGRVGVVVLSAARLEPIDRELVALQATWLHRMGVEQENVQRLDLLSRDLEERNVEIQRALVQAEEAARAKASFLAHMSHELRTPLNGITGIAQLLEGSELDADQRSLVQTQLESARWLREIIDAVLDFSKLEAGSMTLEALPFDLPELVRSAARGVEVLAHAKGLELRVTFSEAAPSWVVGDPIRIRQALLNLLSNAIKFTPRGSVEVRVAPAGGALVRIEVEDQGVGIPPERLEAVFEPFVQADVSTTRRYGGTGLGLSLVRQFARLHGGEAGVHSVVGRGSTFWFTARLPVAAAPPVAAVEGAGGPLGSLRVLVVDDNRVNQLVAERLLAQRGHQVVVAEDGLAALELLRQDRRFDVVLMDCMMPRMDGLEATRRIRGMGLDGRALPVLALTASLTPEDREACRAAGMDGVLGKPLRREELFDALAGLLGCGNP